MTAQPIAAAGRLDTVRQQVAREGYAVVRRAVPTPVVEAALRRINLEIRFRGLTCEQISEWQLGTFYPHLRWEPEISAARPEFAEELLGREDGDRWGDPQIVVRLPDEDQPWPLIPHVDTPPEWAPPGGSYRGVVGVALTKSEPIDGGVVVWPGSHLGRTGPMRSVNLAPGDALVMHPLLQHTGTLNLGPLIRVAIYYRLVAGPFDPATPP